MSLPPKARISARQLTTAQGYRVFDLWYAGEVIASRLTPISDEEATEMVATHLAVKAAPKPAKPKADERHAWRKRSGDFYDDDERGST